MNFDEWNIKRQEIVSRLTDSDDVEIYKDWLLEIWIRSQIKALTPLGLEHSIRDLTNRLNEHALKSRKIVQVEKESDDVAVQQSEIDRLKFRLYGKSGETVDESGNNDDKSVG